MTEQPSEIRESASEKKRDILTRGLLMILFTFLFGIAETVLFFGAIFQFFWMLVKGSPNESIAKFGLSLADWVAIVVRFQTGSSEKLPYPWPDRD